jgi:hypothetical protein
VSKARAQAFQDGMDFARQVDAFYDEIRKDCGPLASACRVMLHGLEQASKFTVIDTAMAAYYRCRDAEEADAEAQQEGQQ